MNLIDQTNERRNYTSETGGADQEANRINNVGGNRWAAEQVPSTNISFSRSGGVLGKRHANSLNANHYDKEETKIRNIRTGQRRVTEVAGYLNLRHGDVVDQAHYYINQIEFRELLIRMILEAKVALALYISARANKKPKCLAEILKYFPSSITPSKVGKCQKKIQAILFSNVDLNSNAEDYIDRAIFKAGFVEEVRRAAKHTASKLQDFTCGKPPKTVAAMAMFMVR